MYTVFDTAHGVKVEIGNFKTLEEAEVFKAEAERRINLTFAFIGKKAPLHALTIEEEAL